MIRTAWIFLMLCLGGGFAGSASAANATLEGLLNQLRGDSESVAVERQVPASASEMKMSFAPLVRETAPAVVNVYATQMARAQRSPFEGDPFFDQFFRRSPSRSRRRPSSLGSGVIVDPSGLVVTNNHVIEGADEVRIALNNGRELEAEIVLRDESVDLAILRVDDGSNLPALDFADSDSMEVGDLVLAIGNPFGVGQTVTSGIVSALARNHVGVSDFNFFIQTDAAINPGNSGGALVDMDGHLAGINTAIYSRSGGSNGIGFSIPANMVRAFLAAAKAGETRFERPWLGAAFSPVTKDIAEAMGLDRPRGVLVADVIENSPAEKCDIEAGDAILAMDSRPIEHPDALGYRLATHPIGTKAQFTILRNGKEMQIVCTPARAPDLSANAILLAGEQPLAGAQIADLTTALSQRMQLKGAPSSGAVVVGIEKESVAAAYGFQPGDAIVELNGNMIDSAAALKRVVDEGSRFWRISLIRDGRTYRQMFNF
ncbi:DegQ family serine endoprotease [Notoacmeibacter sp. MSK16QG-6]|uniref:DegQ family serine endoprotease n=1 Tax=Notoacmeibacter sp. MSK16QG-6 TaxID=2957982 RepID=UPI0020A15DE9|nr:DegQ family serine endoprotease [Notoacmeibacter sp. MSK16QG-6]MCP1200704.1 DegQ family serine endoprotease [Notoacmeibacter sp. MSK16QG-6]